MYCKKCHKSINKNLINCPYCGFNNSNDYEIGDTTEINIAAINGFKEPPKKNKANPTTVTMIAILLIGSVLLVRYFMYDSKAHDDAYYTTTTTKEVVNTKEYKNGEIRLYYTLDFEVLDNVITNTYDNNITIKVEQIDDKAYDEIVNNNELLDATINEIETKTYANDNNYGYLLDVNNKKYHITVNYPVNTSEETLSSINKIINSLKIKE
jgi:hypothetical protein